MNIINQISKMRPRVQSLRSGNLLPPTYRPAARFLNSKHERPTAPSDIAAWMESVVSAAPLIETDVFDPLRARQLQRTLPTRVPSRGTQDLPLNLPTRKEGDVLPKGHHLIYFQPESLLGDLAEDGSSIEYNAPAPYLRRMWAGGSFTFARDPALSLRIGETITQRNSVSSARFKSDMIFVQQQRDLYRGHGGGGGEDWAVREVRTHVFRREVGRNEVVRARAKLAAAADPLLPSALLSTIYTPSAPLLFRYSALTYNGHRIHYDRDWAKAVEGHSDLVVHGPLTATLLVELAEQVAQDKGKRLDRFEYRATSPMYVDLPIRLAVGELIDGVTAEVGAEQDGRVGMRGVATFG